MDLKGFQNKFSKIKRLLDPLMPLDGDYRTLAGLFGMEQGDIRFLGTKPNPTEELFNKYNPTLLELHTHLLHETMKREDVAGVIEKWVETNCDCCKRVSLT